MLINETKNKVWHGRVKLADNFFKRFRGLMLKSKIDYALVFVLPYETQLGASVHMFLMLQSIDVIFLDTNRNVVDFVENLKPWRLYIPKDSAKYIVETPEGVVKHLNVELGDKISWVVEKEKDKGIPAPMDAISKVDFSKINNAISLEPNLKPKLKKP